MNYKVGDKVRFIGEESHKRDPNVFPPVGTIGTITEVDEKSRTWPVKVDWGKDAAAYRSDERWRSFPFICWAKAVDIEPVAESEFINFKVGNLVRFICDKEKSHTYDSYCYPNVGVTEIINEIRNNNLLINWGENSGVSKNFKGERKWFCCENNLELITEMDDDYSDEEVFENDDDKAALMNYKVGDKVRFIDKLGKYKEGSWFRPKDGCIGEVVGASTGNVNCLIKWGEDSGVSAGPHNDYSWYCENECLELVEEEKEKMESSHNFKVGEMVTFISEKKHKETPIFYPPVGTIGRIIEINEYKDDDADIKVDWGEESGTDDNYQWWCNHKHIKAAISVKPKNSDKTDFVNENDNEEVEKKTAWWVRPDTEVPSDEIEEAEETDDVAVLAELVIKKQMEIKKLKEENAKIVARNTELNNMVTCFRNLGFQILNVGTDINIGVNKNV